MKKISLKDIRNGLKRDEMRQISGGSSNCMTNFTCGSKCSDLSGTCNQCCSIA